MIEWYSNQKTIDLKDLQTEKKNMRHAFSEDLFLTTQTGKHLFERYAKNMPIVDFHCHLSPREICENKPFQDLGEMWLAHDHYKWRAMRTFGIDERLITGGASFFEKFLAFAEILPELAGNPLYIWCALELKRFFDIDEPLCAENAADIYRQTKALIQAEGICPRWCMERSNVKLVCTTDDPTDDLRYHRMLREESSFHVRVIPAFRPDKAMNCEKAAFSLYLDELENVTDQRIVSFSALISALERRLLTFQSVGSSISDAGVDNFTWREATDADLDEIVLCARRGEPLTRTQVDQYRSAFLLHMGRLYAKHRFAMQIHIGAYRNANRAMAAALGPDTGFDCMDSAGDLRAMASLLNALNDAESLPKTILYPLNPADLEPYAVLAAAFCKATTRGLVQLGAPWWFNDQVHGMERQFAAVANLYPVALSIGMATDSRSFLSYPRHELYRRVFCNYLGGLIERGEYFCGEDEQKKIVENVCYRNAAAYFDL